jgi:predicted dinucleotide-binding enzyme
VDAAAKETVQALIAQLGYTAIDLGSLEERGRMQQPRGPLAGPDLLVNE